MSRNKLTPAMKQYSDIKAKYSDCILLFRMGDFYETFQNDAELVSDILGITLTKRGNGAASSVPLAGFPYHALEQYAHKLLKAGYRVALCEQMENPKDVKGIVKRDVVEVLSPGTAVLDKFLENKKNNYLGSIIIEKEKMGIAFIDNSTGEFFGGEWDIDKGIDLIKNYDVNEVIISEKQFDKCRELLPNNILLSHYSDWFNDYETSIEKIIKHFKIKNIKGFGLENHPLTVIAAAASLFYLDLNKKNSSDHIKNFRYQGQNEFMQLDSYTVQNLELFKANNNSNIDSSLISIIDKTKTSSGSRMLKKYLKNPLIDSNSIINRQNRVEELIEDNKLFVKISDLLNSSYDIERIISRSSSGKSNPKDLINLKNSLKNISSLKKIITKKEKSLFKLVNKLDKTNEIIARIEKTLIEESPLNVKSGNFINKGISSKLDKTREIVDNSKRCLIELQNKEKNNNNIPSLKIKYNKIFGYYIEVTKTHIDKIPNYFIRKQTLVNAERYYTTELKEFEEIMLSSNEIQSELENKIFTELVDYIVKNSKKILNNAQIFSKFDISVSFAEVAIENNYCRPKFLKTKKIELIDSRHPVIEKLINIDENFIPNDFLVDNRSSQISIITGPNMAGKSTYLRQLALIMIMAQIGSYVPAKKANVFIIDKVYTRVGANDNLSEGESTFLVEMNETANILNNATDDSLIILDEIGRGTSTFDGLALAWSIVEYLHNNKNFSPITLFATHYHELIDLAKQLKKTVNLNVKVIDDGGDLIFMRKVVNGGADKSYGIQVAKMAGIPSDVTTRAKIILNKLILDKKVNLSSSEIDQLEIQFKNNQGNKVVDEILNADVDNLTPVEALVLLKKIKDENS